MKTKIYLFALAIISVNFYCAQLEEAIKKAAESSEKEDTRTETEGVPEEIRDLLSDENLRNLEAGGLEIHRGDTPPLIDGVYFTDTLVLVYKENDNTLEIGHQFSPYYMKFEGQADGAVTLSYKDIYDTDMANGRGGYITGSGDDFTVFVNASGATQLTEYNSLNFTAVQIYTGTLTETGVANWKHSFLMVDKDDDPYNFMMPINAFRIFEETDFMADSAVWPE